MTNDFVDSVAIIYISIQIVVTLLVSVVGVLYVRNEFILEKEKMQRMKLQTKIHETKKPINVDNTNDEDEMNASKEQTVKNEQEEKNEAVIEDRTQKKISAMTKMTFIKLWFKIVWKMRSVYTSFAVHVFDVLTDILVILEWWNLEKNGVDITGIDARIMAICGMTVLSFHKFITTLAFWMKEKNLVRCVLQFLDFLIFQEIYISHKKIVTQFRNKCNSEKDAVDTTTSFKFIRNLEAVFESIPQSILQLVFILRTSSIDESSNSMTLLIISTLSIIQSVISMANSILKNDNTFMNLPKWKKHKQRLPPSIPFLQHALCRVSEVISRIGLFALFWTVCGGLAFGILLAVELCMIIMLTILEYFGGGRTLQINVETLFVRIQGLIILPSELIYAENGNEHYDFNCGSEPSGIFNCGYARIVNIGAGTCMSCCCCYWPSVLLSTLCRCREERDHFIHPSFRIGVSMIEWIILIVWAVGFEHRRIYLFSFQHGLSAFIVSIICFFIYTQYLSLFPNFALPQGVSAHSTFGYAFNGELEELKRIKPRLPMKIYRNKKKKTISQVIDSEKQYWELDVFKGLHDDDKHKTPAMFAVANNHLHVLEWLDTEKQVVKYKENLLSGEEDQWVSIAKRIIDPNNEYFGEL